MPLRENACDCRYSLAFAAASFIQFAPEWLAPYVASLVEKPSNFNCETKPFKENAENCRYSWAFRTACARLMGVACAAVTLPNRSTPAAASAINAAFVCSLGTFSPFCSRLSSRSNRHETAEHERSG